MNNAKFALGLLLLSGLLVLWINAADAQPFAFSPAGAQPAGGGGGVPPSPPAKLAGYVTMGARKVTKDAGYTLKGLVRARGTWVQGGIDARGRYALLVPVDSGIVAGDRVKLFLFKKKKRVTTALMRRVPKFGSMAVSDLDFVSR